MSTAVLLERKGAVARITLNRPDVGNAFASPKARLDAQLDAGARSIAALSRTPEGEKGVAAFAEKRAPDFTGVC
ncbi:hypothetical protein [Sphingomonas koreensis]